MQRKRTPTVRFTGKSSFFFAQVNINLIFGQPTIP